ncbi:unnamed protein product [Camellia sinensis]
MGCYSAPQKHIKTQSSFAPRSNKAVLQTKQAVRACSTGEGEKKNERRSFLTLEEAGLVEISGLDTHERFLCRLTISSLNLLRVISEQEGCSIEELNAGKVCDWFLKDKLKREQNLESAVLQWDDSQFQLPTRSPQIVTHGGDGEGEEEEVGVGGSSGEEEEEEDLQRNRDTGRTDLWRFYMERASNKVGRVTDDSGRSFSALSFSSFFAIITSAMGQVSRELAIHELLKLLGIGIYVIHWFMVADMEAAYLVKVGGGCLIQMTFPSSKPYQACGSTFSATMESLGGFGFSEMGRTVRKKRSNSSRRPRNDSQPFPDYRDNSSLSSTSPSDDVSRISSDDNDGHGTNYWKKELNLNQCSSKASTTNLVEGETTLKISNEDAGCRGSDGAHIKSNSEWEHSGIDSKRCSEGVLAPANWKSVSKVKGLELQSRIIDAQISRRISDTYTSGPSGQSEVASDGAASDNKVKKVKLKVGGVTRTIHTKSMSVGASLGGSSSMKYSHSPDAFRPRKKLILQ